MASVHESSHRNFWSYFEPIRQFMPQNCSADIQAVISHVDQVFTNGTSSQILSLQEQFNLQTLQHLDDAAGACTYYNDSHISSIVLTDVSCSEEQSLELAEFAAIFRSRTSVLRILRRLRSEEWPGRGSIRVWLDYCIAAMEQILERRILF